MGFALHQYPDWPAAMNRATALAYLSLSPKVFDQLESAGSLVGKRLGRNGEKIYDKDQIDAVRRRLFGSGSTDIDDEFEGIDG